MVQYIYKIYAYNMDSITTFANLRPLEMLVVFLKSALTQRESSAEERTDFTIYNGSMLKIEILNRPPTTVSKLMKFEDPEEPTYGSAWRWKPYLP